ncbi:hypothetical protein [Agriterribacter sp.]|uniref:hypothetical protein n=1 Tax=Agriterribacter sp. TaxID=2821509 RepID=UPI002C057505|nr:hypothetical protein [Agriterribacter sp.]HRP56849.1 hypothetical protein [Agriterribacter sp.]
MSLTFKPYHLFALAAVLLIMLSFVPANHPMDLPIQGASYMLSYADTLRAIAMLLLLFWILYMITVRFLFSVFLIWVHIVITLLLLVLIVFLFFHYSGQNASNGLMELSFQTGLSPQMIVPVLIMLLLITQLSYIINLFLGVVRRMN